MKRLLDGSKKGRARPWEGFTTAILNVTSSLLNLWFGAYRHPCALPGGGSGAARGKPGRNGE